ALASPIPGVPSDGARDDYPVLSADGLTLLFASDRGNFNQDDHIWMAQRKAVTDPLGTPSLTALPSNELPTWISPHGWSVYLSCSGLNPGGGPRIASGPM